MAAMRTLSSAFNMEHLNYTYDIGEGDITDNTLYDLYMHVNNYKTWRK
jgi:hypothetical protein